MNRAFIFLLSILVLIGVGSFSVNAETDALGEFLNSNQTVVMPYTPLSGRISARVSRVKTSLAEQCKKIKPVNFLIKADTSHHIPGGDRRRGSYSVIGSGANCRPCPSGRCDILYKDGTKAGSVGYYGQWSRSHGGNGCARYYGGAGGAPAHSANSIISTAGRKGGKLYMKSGSTCYEWKSNLRRVGRT